MKKKTLGYGYIIGKENIMDVIANYGGIHLLHSTRNKTKEEIAHNLATRLLSKQAKPKIFKVTVEVE